MDDITVRPAKEDELSAVAELRWRWVLENGSSPGTGQEEFVRRFVSWVQVHKSSHHCLVMVRGEAVIGMAWLAIIQRVPTPHALDRASGDVQCVYVLPEHRDAGLGSRLIEAVVNLARELRLERLTVHSSTRAISAYSRGGFVISPRLLQVELGKTKGMSSER
ncbi:GNAT family N-acetyltransferase [Amycolatopsis rhizosphaerae]|uniref:GNAT family N-acetyltransferase n=1 Tax=Amycolatopsis rhizosphaerae TaxID=2053003 RepID=A0A558CT80_9PSEU|nr:GNAT family N-acetyltransferase [Amycolatopsis rhizosphaerae]TVT51981.1 GNAT family N-acetyltransferase [Amycolatopsis rhizosphaerae]